MQGVNSEMIAAKMEEGKAVCCTKEELMAILDDKKLYNNAPDLLITAGAGDIDTLVGPIKKMMQ